MVSVTMNDVTFRLQEAHDFAWLQSLGKVFCVFDQQDSGNIGFGVANGGEKRFVKFAGAKPLDYSGDPQEAVKRLAQAMPTYAVLDHPNAIRLIDHYPVADGYAAVFEWFEGECLHSHWNYAGAAKYDHPDSPYRRYRQLSVHRRLASLDAIFAFHAFVASKGYVAVDFYDGSILYDFANDETRICDIDFYRPVPAFNDMGEHFWGPKRSKSPEEFTLGAPIDERTNVFAMGAIAFGLLGGESDRSRSKWDADAALYEVALRAVSPERGLRYGSVAAFKSAWDAAAKASNE